VPSPKQVRWGKSDPASCRRSLLPPVTGGAELECAYCSNRTHALVWCDRTIVLSQRVAESAGPDRLRGYLAREFPRPRTFSSKAPPGANGLRADGLGQAAVHARPPIAPKSRQGRCGTLIFAHDPQRNRFRFSGSCASLARSVFRRLSVEPKPRYRSRKGVADVATDPAFFRVPDAAARGRLLAQLRRHRRHSKAARCPAVLGQAAAAGASRTAAVAADRCLSCGARNAGNSGGPQNRHPRGAEKENRQDCQTTTDAVIRAGETAHLQERQPTRKTGPHGLRIASRHSSAGS
jgi:hypothetical protein